MIVYYNATIVQKVRFSRARSFIRMTRLKYFLKTVGIYQPLHCISEDNWKIPLKKFIVNAKNTQFSKMQRKVSLRDAVKMQKRTSFDSWWNRVAVQSKNLTETFERMHLMQNTHCQIWCILSVSVGVCGSVTRFGKISPLGNFKKNFGNFTGCI